MQEQAKYWECEWNIRTNGHWHNSSTCQMLTVVCLIAMRGGGNTKRCCVPHCHAWGRKHKTLKFYVIPKDKQQRKHWIARIRNENLTKNARVCSLHFIGGCKGYQEIPSIFPWTKEWEHVIENHNEMIVNTHAQNGSSLDKVPLLTLSRPKHSGKTPACRREHIRTSTLAKVTCTIITIFPTHQSFINSKT